MIRVMDPIEYDIAARVVTDLLERGYELTYCHDDDDENERQKLTEVTAATMDELFACGSVVIDTRSATNSKSFVKLIEGNGDCIISDYGVSLEGALTRANAVANWWDNADAEATRPAPMIVQCP